MALKCSIVNAATFGVPLGGPRSAMNASRVGCTLPASSVARLCRTTGRPSQLHGMRKPGERLAQNRRLQCRLRPALTTVGRDFDFADAAISRKGDAGDLVEAGPPHVQ